MQSVPNLCLRKAAWALWSPWAAKFPDTNPAREIMWSCHMGNKGPEMSRDFVERASQISLAFPPSPPRCQGAVWMCPGAPDDCCLHWHHVEQQNPQAELKKSKELCELIKCRGTSPVVQWLRIHFARQGTQVWSLAGELRSHMLWGNQQCAPQLQSPHAATETQRSQINQKVNKMTVVLIY